MYRVRDVMNRSVQTVDLDAPVLEARTLFTSTHVRHLPVMEGLRVVGVLSPKDLLDPIGDAEPVIACMSAPAVVVSPHLPLRRAAALLLERRIGCLPVVNGNGMLCGLLSESDLVAFAALVARDLDELSVRGRAFLGFGA